MIVDEFVVDCSVSNDAKAWCLYVNSSGRICILSGSSAELVSIFTEVIVNLERHWSLRVDSSRRWWRTCPKSGKTC